MVWYGVGMVWYGVGMVFGMACYGLLCCVEACEQVRTMPASRNPLEGNLHPAAPGRLLLVVVADVPHCCTCSPAVCLDDIGGDGRTSDFLD